MILWIGVDFDGTLAFHDPDKALIPLGAPIMPMVNMVKKWHNNGVLVKIVTARVSVLEPINWQLDTDFNLMKAYEAATQKRLEDAHLHRKLIERWSKEHLGFITPVTAQKDFAMLELWDDRAIQVEHNTGLIIGKSCFDTVPS